MRPAESGDRAAGRPRASTGIVCRIGSYFTALSITALRGWVLLLGQNRNELLRSSSAGGRRGRPSLYVYPMLFGSRLADPDGIIIMGLQ